MQNIKGAIFDMDGTLLDSMPVWKRLTQNYLKQFDLHITDQDFAACEGFSQPQVADYFLERQNWRRRITTMLRFWGGRSVA